MNLLTVTMLCNFYVKFNFMPYPKCLVAGFSEYGNEC